MGRKWGFHSGKLTCKEIEVDGNFTVEGNFTFGDAATDTLTVNGAATFNADSTISTTKKLQFRDTGIYIQSPADGKIKISADGTGSDDITLSGTVTLGDLLTTKGIATAHTSKSADYTTTGNDVIVGVDSSGGAVTITLASATVTAGRMVIIKDEGGQAGTNNITIATEGSETIDGAASKTISTNYGVLRLYSDGTNWFTF